MDQMTATARRELTRTLVVETAMLIRCPSADVFAAFVDPDITSRFWFSRGSGRLTPGARVTWEWRWYGVSSEVEVREVEKNARIVLDWDLATTPTTVEWTFSPRGDGATYVQIVNSGFHGDGDAVVASALDAAGGFAFVLAGAKAYLEHGIALNLVVDHAPDANVATS